MITESNALVKASPRAALSRLLVRTVSKEVSTRMINNI